MIDFLAQHLPELIMSLITAGALGLCGWFHQQTTNYQKLLKEQEDERVQELIRKQIEPLVTELKDIRKYVKDFENNEKPDLNFHNPSGNDEKRGRTLFSLFLLDKIFRMSFDDGFDAVQSS